MLCRERVELKRERAASVKSPSFRVEAKLLFPNKHEI